MEDTQLGYGNLDLGSSLLDETKEAPKQPKPEPKLNKEELTPQKKPAKKVKTLTHEEKISKIAKEIIKISDGIDKKVKMQEKIEEEISQLKREIIEKEEEAQDLIKEHLKELKKTLR